MTAAFLEGLEKYLRNNLISVDDLPPRNYKNSRHIVYFLFDQNEIVYIGKCEHGFNRIYDHKSSKNFSHYSFIEFAKDIHLTKIEDQCILHFVPNYNIDSSGRLFFDFW
jgi:hypothetical protein